MISQPSGPHSQHYLFHTSVTPTMSPTGWLLNLFYCLCLTSLCLPSSGRIMANRAWSPYDHKTHITDFRYNTARVDGITRLINGSLIVLSNGYYWTLNKGQLPRSHNVKGTTSQLYPGFKNIDAIWTDPYDDISPQIYLASNSAKNGLRVVCQEFYEEFSNDSSFCHLPVDKMWTNALQDLDINKPIDAVTWRNRSKDKDGGFWVFFQGQKMITIDPYEMNLRFTYDIKKWMSINESLTATFYDYQKSVYHLFFDNNRYFTWTVNVSFMNRLPMSWDRAFLHGTLSPPMKINVDFFGFSQREVRNRPQPNYQRFGSADVSSSRSRQPQTTPVPNTSPKPSTIRTTLYNRYKTSSTSRYDISDVSYVTPKTHFIFNGPKNGKIRYEEEENKHNSLEQDSTDMISYQKQLMQLDQEGVLDFAYDSARTNAARKSYLNITLVGIHSIALLMIVHIFMNTN